MVPMKWAIIGCGNVVETKSGPAFGMLDFARLCEITALYSRSDAEKIAGILGEQRHSGPVIQSRPIIASSAEEAMDNCDAVYIATTPDSHLHYARLAAERKLPTLVEKPMALNVTEASIMASMFQEAGVPLWVAYYRRYLPKFIKLKEILDSGALGRILGCQIVHTFLPEDHPVAPVIAGKPIPWRYDKKINGGGNFVDMGTHHLDLIDWFFGPIKDVSAHVSNFSGLYDAEDTVTASMVTDRGVHVTGLWSYACAETKDIMKVYGTHGTADIRPMSNDNGDIDCYFYFRGGDGRGGISGGSFFNNYSDVKHSPKYVHSGLIGAIMEEVTGGPKCIANWENGLRAMRVQDKILNARPQA